MRIAVCDIGSNTVKMKVYECTGDNVDEVYSVVKNAKLISYIKDGSMSKNGIDLLCNIISELVAISKKEGASHFYAFATASLRKAKNVLHILNTVYGNCNISIDLIPGDEEAYLSYSGVKNKSEYISNNSIFIDMGGGSTEIVIIENGEITKRCSMNFGSLSLYLDFSTFPEMKTYAQNQIKSNFENIKSFENAILVGGTALAINKLYNRFFNTDNNSNMSMDSLVELYNYLINNPLSKDIINQTVPDRVTTVIPGMSAYLGIFEIFGIKNIIVSKYGIREGYVYEKVLKRRTKNERT